MPFLELSLRCRASDEARLEAALEDLGALSVSLLDANDADNEDAILEPGVAETPLWPEIIVLALFAQGTNEQLLLHALEAWDGRLDLSSAAFREVQDQDWERAWMDQFRPMRFGERTWIVPSNQELPADADAQSAVVVHLDPGLAFGSGTHPTTALCLAWLDGLQLRGKTVLDFGCGSGILALAALKLGAARAVGVDIDPLAVETARYNAAQNGVTLEVFDAQQAPQVQATVTVANILANPLRVLAPAICGHTRPGADIALSGILPEQAAAVIEAYSPWADLAVTREDAGWVLVTGRRRQTPC